MTRHRRTAAVACIAIVATLATIAGSAPAETVSPALGIRPARQVVTVERSATARGEVQLRNRSGEPIRYELSGVDLEAGDADSFARPTERPGAFSPSAWVAFAPGERTLAPGAERTESLRISIPESVPPGVYTMAVVAVQQFAPLDVNHSDRVGSKVQVRAGLGATVVIEVPGDASADARIVDIDSPTFVTGSDEPTFTVVAKNTGTTLLKLEAATKLDAFASFASRTLTSDEQPTLPGGERRLEMRWTDRPWFGWYRPHVVVVGGTGSGVRVEQDAPVVIVLPPWWLLALLVVAIAVPVVASVRRRRRIRRNVEALRAQRAAEDAEFDDDSADER